MNPIGQNGGSDNTSKIFESGNLKVRNFQYFDASVMGTIGVTSGKWYYEVTYDSSTPGTSGPAWGWCNSRFNIDAGLSYTVPSSSTGGDTIHIYGVGDSGTIRVTSGVHNESGSNWANTDKSASSGQICGIAVDFDNSKAYFSVDGSFTDVRSGQDPANGTNPCLAPSGGLYTWNLTADNLNKYGPWYPAIGNWAASSRTVRVNFGQDSTFQGQVSAGGNADENGFGDFKYAPPAGFLAICTGNLPISADIDVAQTNTDGPHQQFNSVVYSGNNSTNAITGLGFQPDLLWIKQLNTTSNYSNALVDSTRGRAKVSYSSRTQSEATSGASNDVISFDSDGFTLGANSEIGGNGSGSTNVAWAWKANGGTTASNTQGATNSVTQANTKAGFSIVTYTGISGSSGSSTVGHGLTQAPEFIMHISRTRAAGRWIQHMATSGSSYVLQMGSSAETDYSGYGTIASPTATTFGINGIDGIGGESADYVAYVWHSVPGASKFGQYIGNGDNAGTYIHTGFRVAMIAFKRVDGGSEPWTVFDNKRAPYNPTSAHSYSQVYWDSTAGASSGSTHAIDFLANGVKLRGNGGANNHSDGVYAYCAWGDVSFKYNNTF